MIRNKTIIFILIIFFFNLKLLGFENKIIMKVNNEIITSFDLKNKIKTILMLAGQNIDQENINKTKALALNSIINLKLKALEVEKNKVNVDETEVFSHLSKISANDVETFKSNFLANGLSFEFFKSEIKTELAWRKLIYGIYNNKINVKEEEIIKEMEQIIKNQSTLKEYKISEIEISFTNENEKNEKIAIVEDYLRSNDFSDAALKYSEAPSYSNGGNLGWLNEKALSKDIGQNLKKMTIGEVSKPIINLNTILFLKLVDKKNKTINDGSLNDIRKNLVDRKKNDLFQLYSRNHLSKIKNTAFIENQ